jgi:ketosteroid isomerase-like protein
VEAGADLVARLYERWNARDLDGCIALHHPEFEMVTSGTFPDLEPVYKGPRGFRQFWNGFYGIWERLTISLHEVIDTGDRVLALWVFDGEGRDGVRVQREGAHLITLREGLVLRMEVYGRWDCANRSAARKVMLQDEDCWFGRVTC